MLVSGFSQKRSGRSRPTFRDVALASLTLFSIVATFGSGTLSASAFDSVTTGITNGQYSDTQAYAVQRVPAIPTCTDSSTYDLLSLLVNVNSPATNGFPWSNASDAPVDIGTGYLTIFATGVPAEPWGLDLFNNAQEELRYDGAAWVTQPAGGWTSELVFADQGQIYGVGAEGFLFDSAILHLGTFFANPGNLTPGDYVNYTPLAAENDCISGLAVGNAGALATYSAPTKDGQGDPVAAVVPVVPVDATLATTGVDSASIKILALIACAMALVGCGIIFSVRCRRTRG